MFCDNPGILKDVSNSITNYKDTNIHSVNISTKEGFFHGVVTVYVTDLQHLQHLLTRLKKVKGVFTAERLITGQKHDR
jgi:(p)ppGpp synthase/HD superfamily hydrolase